MGETDLIKLYSQRLLALAADIPHAERLKEPRRTADEIARARDELAAMLREGGPVPASPFDGYEALTPARDYKNRHASILLVLEATADAFAKVA